LLWAALVAALLVLAALITAPAGARSQTICCFEFSAQVATDYTVDYGKAGCDPTYPGNIRFGTYDLSRRLSIRSIVSFDGHPGYYELGERSSRIALDLDEVSVKTKSDESKTGQPCYAEHTTPVPCSGADQVGEGEDAFYQYGRQSPLTGGRQGAVDVFAGGPLHLDPGEGPNGEPVNSSFRPRCPDGTNHTFGDSYDLYVKAPQRSFFEHASQGDRCRRRVPLRFKHGAETNGDGIPYLTHTFDGSGFYELHMSYFPRSQLHRESKALRHLGFERTLGEPEPDGWGKGGSGQRLC
jgi:hypothetical protein